ncbi:MAG: hypothetical protein IPO81_16175 [Kouleothrix sp.]|nr:hypothetical protein [Kouleothrix sp.]
MGVFKSIANVVYREYDRRIKRASLVTEYGAHQHGHAADHADEVHAAGEPSNHDEGAEEAEIVNVPRGTPVATSQHAAAGPADAQH